MISPKQHSCPPDMYRCRGLSDINVSPLGRGVNECYCQIIINLPMIESSIQITYVFVSFKILILWPLVLKTAMNYGHMYMYLYVHLFIIIYQC